MASLHRQSPKGNWYVAFRTADGRHHFLSSGTKSKAQAEVLRRKLADATKAARQLAKRGRLTTERAREIIDRAVMKIAELIGSPADGETTRDFFNAWLTEKARSASEGTMHRYRGIVKRWLEWLGGRADENRARLNWPCPDLGDRCWVSV